MMANPENQKPRNVIFRERLAQKQSPENQWPEKVSSIEFATIFGGIE